jgi:protein TonB
VDVARDGFVQAARVQAGSGHDLLDEAALRAVRKWRFQPGTRDGEPVAMQVLVPVHFILKDNP